jgi:hypothetical protein
MKWSQLSEAGDPITPKITWKTNGDKSFTVRIEYTPEKVYVHTNKKREVLEQIVKDRYGPKTFV